MSFSAIRILLCANSTQFGSLLTLSYMPLNVLRNTERNSKKHNNCCCVIYWQQRAAHWNFHTNILPFKSQLPPKIYLLRCIYLRPDTTIIYNTKCHKLILRGYMFRLLMQPKHVATQYKFVVLTIVNYCCVWQKYIHLYIVTQRDDLHKGNPSFNSIWQWKLQ